MRFEYGALRFPALFLLYFTTCLRPSLQQQQSTSSQSSSQITFFPSNAQGILEHHPVQKLRLECGDKVWNLKPVAEPNH